MRNICPVCGYDGLPRPAGNHEICPSCGTEFGYDDASTSHEQLRGRWLTTGPRWWLDTTPAPIGWDPWTQLRNITNDKATVTTSTLFKLGEDNPEFSLILTIVAEAEKVYQSAMAAIQQPLEFRPSVQNSAKFTLTSQPGSTLRLAQNGE